MVVAVAVVGVLVLVALSVICYAAYKIKAQSFEFSTVILKFVSLSIKIISPGAEKNDEQSEP